MTKNEQLETEFIYQIHYYFNDESHTMDALVQNKAEKYFIEVAKKISKNLDTDLNIEVMPLEEGGLIQKFVFGIGIVGSIAHYFQPFMNDFLTHQFTKNEKEIELNIKSKELDNKIKEAILKQIKEDSKNKELENKIKEEELKSLHPKKIEEIVEFKLSKILYDKEVERNVSNYYKQVNNYNKITHIGFQDLNSTTKESKIYKNSFHNYILEDTKLQDIDENAEIEVISPVLNTGTYDWRGVYKGEIVDFSMGDTKFKEEVKNGKYKFANGSKIECILLITTKYDKDNEIVGKIKYSVKSVHKIYDSIGARTTIKGKQKYKRELDSSQKNLFEI